MDDGRSLAVEVAQLSLEPRHEGWSIADHFWENTVLLNGGHAVSGEKLHD